MKFTTVICAFTFAFVGCKPSATSPPNAVVDHFDWTRQLRADEHFLVDGKSSGRSDTTTNIHTITGRWTVTPQNPATKITAEEVLTRVISAYEKVSDEPVTWTEMSNAERIGRYQKDGRNGLLKVVAVAEGVGSVHINADLIEKIIE